MNRAFFLLPLVGIAFLVVQCTMVVQSRAQVLPLPTVPVVRQHLTTADTEWMEIYKPERDPRTQDTLDRLLTKDFFKRLPNLEIGVPTNDQIDLLSAPAPLAGTCPAR